MAAKHYPQIVGLVKANTRILCFWTQMWQGLLCCSRTEGSLTVTKKPVAVPQLLEAIVGTI